MKYVDFKSIEIKNFLSIGEEPVIINFNKGLNVITGINRDKEGRRNGVGKSTIVDAIFYSIFGETIRDLKKNHIVNNITNSTGYLKLCLTVDDPYYGVNEFVIVRTINPSKCYIYKNGIDKTLDSISNNNEYIQRLISASPDIFKSCVFMSLNNHIPFMAKTKGDKRKFIEEIFNLEVFTKMLTQVKSDYNSLKKDFDLEVSRFDETKNFLNIQEKINANFESDKEVKVLKYTTKIKESTDKIKELEKANLKLEKLDPNKHLIQSEEIAKLIEEEEKKVKESFELLIDAKAKVDNLTINISELVSNSDTCPACLRPIGNAEKIIINNKKKDLENEKKALIASIKKLKNDYDKHSKLLKDHNSTLTNVKDKYQECLHMKSNIVNITKNIQSLNESINDYNEELTSLSNEQNTLQETIDTLKSKIEEYTGNIEKYKKNINMLDIVKFIVSEEGVKSYIVRKIIQEFNARLAYYLKKLDSNSIIFFNEYFEEEIVNEKGKSCSYENFSGAEKKSIDLACLFSFIDIRISQGNVHYNISFYDELLDSSFDEKGVNLVLEILHDRHKKLKECIYVITHRKESLKNFNNDVVFLEKKNGITRRISSVD